MCKPPVSCIYVHIPHSTHCVLSCSTIGDPKVPFFKTPSQGFLYIDDSSCLQNKIAYTIIFGPMVLIVQIVNIYPLPPVASFILVILSLNLVVSCPYVSYYLYLHIFMLFRSTCLWLFSVDNPPRVATEALNIHLVSCILYHIWEVKKKWMDLVQLTWNPPPPAPLKMDYVFFLTIVLSFFSNF